MASQSPNEQMAPPPKSTAVMVGPAARLDAIKAELGKASKSLAAMLPRHVTVDRMIRIVTSAASRTPDLLDCTPRSIVLATAQACALGLEPNTPLGLGYLVPYGKKDQQRKECQFIPGYKGLIRLAVNSGEVVSVQARIVYERDTFAIDYGTEQRIVHTPHLAAEDPGRIVGAYAVADLKGGTKMFEFLTIHQITNIRRRSPAADAGPWVTDFEEMCRKTAVRRLCKMLPLSEERLARALEHQARAESGDGPDYGDVIEVIGDVAEDAATAEPRSRSEETRERLQQKAAGAA